VVVVMHDISEVKRLETVRREFVANISHELRTPLTAIRGFIDTLDGEPELTEADRQRFLAAASRHVHRLSNLVNDLLALAKLDSPEFKLELVACDIQSEVERALELHVAAAHERGVALSSAVEAGLPSVLADPVALEQILSNLIDNAIKYNRPEGRVVVRGVRVGDLLRIAVEDTGVGIPAVHLPRIFERLSGGSRALARRRWHRPRARDREASRPEARRGRVGDERAWAGIVLLVHPSVGTDRKRVAGDGRSRL
jgi:two-component system phosphate regulon sensor histidine kinase PhoR